MRVAIFCKTYPADYEWLDYMLRSVEKYAKGFSDMVVVSPDLDWMDEGGREPRYWTGRINLTALKRDEHNPGYLWQQCCKVSADVWTAPSFIMYIDSDCVLDREFHASELFRDGKPMLLRRTWEEAGEAICWRKPTEDALGIHTKYETMCCHPLIYHRETLQRFRRRIQQMHGVDANQYILNQPSFSEFNALGNHALNFEPQSYAIIDCGPDDGYPRPIRQAYSWGGLTPQVRAEWERICA